MSASLSYTPEPLWRRALLARDMERMRQKNRGASARSSLQRALAQAGYFVGLVSIHQWPRARQGEAYLWARARILGREDLPAPQWLVDVGEVQRG